MCVTCLYNMVAGMIFISQKVVSVLTEYQDALNKKEINVKIVIKHISLVVNFLLFQEIILHVFGKTLIVKNQQENIDITYD